MAAQFKRRFSQAGSVKAAGVPALRLGQAAGRDESRAAVAATIRWFAAHGAAALLVTLGSAAREETRESVVWAVFCLAQTAVLPAVAAPEMCDTPVALAPGLSPMLPRRAVANRPLGVLRRPRLVCAADPVTGRRERGAGANCGYVEGGG